jgi:hypothetical protein
MNKTALHDRHYNAYDKTHSVYHRIFFSGLARVSADFGFVLRLVVVMQKFAGCFELYYQIFMCKLF